MSRMPHGGLYINSKQIWEWLADKAAKAARWWVTSHLNASSMTKWPLRKLFSATLLHVEPSRQSGEGIIIPTLDKALPGFTVPNGRLSSLTTSSCWAKKFPASEPFCQLHK